MQLWMCPETEEEFWSRGILKQRFLLAQMLRKIRLEKESLHPPPSVSHPPSRHWPACSHGCVPVSVVFFLTFCAHYFLMEVHRERSLGLFGSSCPPFSSISVGTCAHPLPAYPVSSLFGHRGLNAWRYAVIEIKVSTTADLGCFLHVCHI